MDRRTVVAALGLGAALLIGPGCASRAPASGDPSDGAPYLVREELGGMDGVHQVGPLWIGGGGSAGDLVLAARRGVTLVVDLCPAEARAFDAAAVCAEQEVAYRRVPFDPDGPGSECVDDVLAVLDGHDEGPVLIVGRTGSEAALVLAIHRAVRWELSLDDALAEGRRAGMKPECEAFVAEQVARIAAG